MGVRARARMTSDCLAKMNRYIQVTIQHSAPRLHREASHFCILPGHCEIREAKATRRWAQRATWHTRVATNGGWITIAREPEKMWTAGNAE